ncbi:MAG: hypothetical protein K5695_13380 [Oscillospiraceae bacterium]|nr:hypothetical protein [Oscillospiraceae bacterium]
MGMFSGAGFGVLVDLGGSGAKIAAYSGGKIGAVRRCSVSSEAELFAGIQKSAEGKTVTSLAFSVAGFVNAGEGSVLRSACYPFLEGELAAHAEKAFPRAKVRVVNDGEAHARSLLLQPDVRFGAIHLAFGTSVAFGVINEKKEVIQTVRGENWDIGCILLNTRASEKDVWWALGSNGLAELENTPGVDPYLHFGCRMGTLLNQLAVIFRPYTIGISGGIITAHAREIEQGVREELREPPFSEKPEIRFLPGQDTVMQGLTTLL